MKYGHLFQKAGNIVSFVNSNMLILKNNVAKFKNHVRGGAI